MQEIASERARLSEERRALEQLKQSVQSQLADNERVREQLDRETKQISEARAREEQERALMRENVQKEWESEKDSLLGDLHKLMLTNQQLRYVCVSCVCM